MYASLYIDTTPPPKKERAPVPAPRELEGGVPRQEDKEHHARRPHVRLFVLYMYMYIVSWSWVVLVALVYTYTDRHTYTHPKRNKHKILHTHRITPITPPPPKPNPPSPRRSPRGGGSPGPYTTACRTPSGAGPAGPRGWPRGRSPQSVGVCVLGVVNGVVGWLVGEWGCVQVGGWMDSKACASYVCLYVCMRMVLLARAPGHAQPHINACGP